jgi:hypothetical protein
MIKNDDFEDEPLDDGWEDDDTDTDKDEPEDD